MIGLPKRFIEKFVTDSSGCWVWVACRAANGYGRFGVGKAKHVPAHRFSYEVARGPVPSGLELDHVCRNKACVNPDHLEAVTHSENMRRAEINYKKPTHCIAGHEFTPENTQTIKTGRRCAACHRRRARDAYRSSRTN